MDDALFNSLKQLSAIIKKTIDDGISNGELKPEDCQTSQLKIKGFQYTDRGISISDIEEDDVTERRWVVVSYTVSELVKKSQEYQSVMKQLISVFDKKEEDLPKYLVWFVTELISG